MKTRSKRILALPERKQQEIHQAIDVMLSASPVPVHFIILFGSYARGDWIEDCYVGDDSITYSYQSDYDFLVVIENCPLRKQQAVEIALNKALDTTFSRPPGKETLWSLLRQTPLSLLVHDIQHVNKHLAERQYFFSDIKREGIVLYNSKGHKLARLKPLGAKDRYHLAVEDFEYWFESASDFFSTYQFNSGRKKYSLAAFELHQATERLYSTLLLVYTHYKPRTHDLEKLKKHTNSLDNRLILMLPTITPEDKRLFELLKRAYTEARYNKDYRITHNELLTLQQHIEAFMTMTKQLCEEKITTLKHKAYPNES